MENYDLSVKLLGLRDQNLPVFKDIRMKRLASIDKIKKLHNVAPRLSPDLPRSMFVLDRNDPEFDDKMIYPRVNYNRLLYQIGFWAMTTAFYCYNWNVLNVNKRLRHLRNLYPVYSVGMLVSAYHSYFEQLQRVRLFEEYCETRAKELFEENKYLFDLPDFKKYVYFQEDLKETLARVHRQANEHSPSDFKDSEIIIQDFIDRYCDPNDPASSLYNEEGKPRLLN